MSTRHKTIVDKASNEKERQQHRSLSTQAYQLFSKGKRPVEVAIILNIRESEVTQYYREYWSLIELDALNQIYKEIKYDIWHFVNLYRSAKSEGMSVQHVVKLLEVANNRLPAVENRYEQLKNEISLLEFDKRNSARDFQNLNDQIISMGKALDSICLDCEKEMARLQQLQQERMKQEAPAQSSLLQ
jgi:hypothetical protein